ncbi:MAG: endonuclease NucS [Candidatus Bathyarchaeota archaeon]|nr:endonuclease NucS [Candidatus Bathyarchaeota archaeon]
MQTNTGTPEVRLWKIKKNTLEEIHKPKLDLEERLESWIASDISIIAQNLLVIDRQCETDYGGVIDLLCIDEKGDLIIIELKRDKTPREITAQVLDYASWVKHLSPEKVQRIAERYLKNVSFEEAYQTKFNQSLPESINEELRMLVVGSKIDSSSQRIINYLSENYRVAINAITFNYFKEGKDEFLARTFLIEPSRVPVTPSTSSKRRPNLTYEQLQEISDERGVGEVYSYLFNELQQYLRGTNRTRSSIAFTGEFRETKRSAIFNLIPTDSDSEHGLRWQLYDLRFREYFNISEEKLLSILPSDREPWRYGTPGDQKSYAERDILEQWSGYTGYIKMPEARKFIQFLQELTQERNKVM